MGVGGRYDDFLRQIYRNTAMELLRHPKGIVLDLPNKAMNKSMGPEGQVPGLLVSGVIPRVSAATVQLPDQAVHLSMMQSAGDGI